MPACSVEQKQAASNPERFRLKAVVSANNAEYAPALPILSIFLLARSATARSPNEGGLVRRSSTRWSHDEHMAERDRDESGRPRNTRARDALARLLPLGSKGVPCIPDDLEIPPIQSLAYAQICSTGAWRSTRMRCSRPRGRAAPTTRDRCGKALPSSRSASPTSSAEPRRCDYAAWAGVRPPKRGGSSGAVLRGRRRSGRLGRCAGRRTCRGRRDLTAAPSPGADETLASPSR